MPECGTAKSLVTKMETLPETGRECGNSTCGEFDELSVVQWISKVHLLPQWITCTRNLVSPIQQSVMGHFQHVISPGCTGSSPLFLYNGHCYPQGVTSISCQSETIQLGGWQCRL
jgi:hypothetical protein